MNKKVKRSSALSFSGALLLILAAVLIIVYFITTNESIQQWYAKYEDLLYRIDLAIVSIGYDGIITLVIFALYAVKCFVPIISIPALCVLSGMVYPTFPALIVNLAGFIIMLTVRYKFGVSHGGGNAHKLLCKNSISRMLLEHNGTGNPWTLFVLRLIPGLPINAVSQMYGAMGFDFKRYIIISLWGFIPKLFSYTFIGVYVFDPLSFQFFLPIIVLLVISGGSLLILNAILNHYKTEKV